MSFGHLNKIKETGYSLIIPGHGEVVETSLLMDRQFEYLDNAKKEIEKIIASSGGMKDLGSITLEKCVKDSSYFLEDQLQQLHRQTIGLYTFSLRTHNKAALYRTLNEFQGNAGC